MSPNYSVVDSRVLKFRGLTALAYGRVLGRKCVAVETKGANPHSAAKVNLSVHLFQLINDSIDENKQQIPDSKG